MGTTRALAHSAARRSGAGTMLRSTFLGCAVLACVGSAVAQLGQAAELTVPPSVAAAAATEGKVAALAALTVLPADDCSADQAASGACSEVKLTGSDQVTLSNVKPPYFPSGG